MDINPNVETEQISKLDADACLRRLYTHLPWKLRVLYSIDVIRATYLVVSQ
jgi:hypothetical protein